MPSQLYIQMLGRFRVQRDDGMIPDRAWGTHRAKALLKLLLTSFDRTLSRDQIMDALWPDATPKAAAQALYTAASDLRRVLEPDLRRGGDSCFILSSDGGYQFNGNSPHIVDVQVFERYVAQARRYMRDGALEVAVQAYASAEAIYGGDYLPEDLYADWCLAERERLRALLLDMLLEAADAQLQLGRQRQAIASCHRALTFDTCSELAYRLLMEAHSAAGNQAQALRVYAECETTLREELGLDPSPETVALAQRLQQPRPVAPRAVAPPADPPAPPTYSPAHMPFIGRAMDQQMLQRLWVAVSQAQGGLVLVVGEAGIGKSTLVRRVFAPEARSVRGVAHELTQGVPYHLLADLIRDASQIGLAPVLPERLQAQLAYVLPEAAQDGSAEALARPLVSQKSLLFDALRAWFLALGGDEGCVIVLEDLHWADQETLEFLAALGPQLARSNLLLVATCRPLDRLKPLLERAGRDAWLHALRLRPLSEQELVELVGLLAPPAPQLRAFAQRLHKVTGGNPLFAANILARLFETGQLWHDPHGGWQGLAELLSSPTFPIPEQVDELVAQRTAALSTEARRLINVLAVIEHEADEPLLQAIAGGPELDEAMLLEALEELLAADLISALPDGSFALRHAAIREAVYARLIIPRRQRLHAAVGSALVAVARGQEGLIGEHFFRGARWREAADYLLRAGATAAQVNAAVEARAYYERALQALAHLVDSPALREQHVQALLALANLSYLSEPPEQSLARLTAAEHLLAGLPAAQARPQQGRIALGRGRAHAVRGDQRASQESLQLALEIARELGDSALAAIPSAAFGIVAYQQGRFEAAAGMLARAMAALERMREWDYWLLTISHHALTLAMRGAPTAASAAAQRGLGYAQEAGHATGVAQMWTTLCIIGWASRNLELARSAGEEALAAAGRSGDLLLSCLAYYFQAWLELRCDQRQRAEPQLLRARALEQQLGLLPFYGDWFAAAAAERELLAGNHARALALVESAPPLTASGASLFARGLAQRVAGLALLELDQARQRGPAEARLLESVRLFAEGQARLEEARSHVACAELCQRYDDPGAALAHLRAAGKLFAAAGLDEELALARQRIEALERPRLR